jgi:hypothetical protein
MRSTGQWTAGLKSQQCPLWVNFGPNDFGGKCPLSLITFTVALSMALLKETEVSPAGAFGEAEAERQDYL